MKRIIIMSLLFFTATQKATPDAIDNPSYGKKAISLSKKALSLVWHLGQVASGALGEGTALSIHKDAWEKLRERNIATMRRGYPRQEENNPFANSVITAPIHIACLTTLKCGLQGLYKDLNIKGLINYLGKKLIKNQEEEAV